MLNPDILLWFIRGKKRRETRNMIHFCETPFAIPAAPTHFDKNPLNVNHECSKTQFSPRKHSPACQARKEKCNFC